MNIQNISNSLNQFKIKTFELKNYFTSEFHYEKVFHLFRTILFCFLLLDTLLMLPVAVQFWGSHAYLPQNKEFQGFYQVFNLISIFEKFPSFYILFVLGKIIFLCFGILNIAPLFCTIGVYFCLLNLDNKAWTILNGGNNIVHVVFIYLILMHFGKENSTQKNALSSSNHFTRFFGNTLANFAFLSAQLQIVIVYFVAGLTKLQSNLWRDGVALYYVLQTREFTHPWAQKIFLSSDLLIMFGTYGTLLFQLSFPWLVWNRNLKKYFLFIGTLIHLQIAFVMGLFDFGITVSIMYLLFLNKNEALALGNKLFPLNQITVGFDPNCKLCMQFAKFMKFFDLNNQLIIDNALIPKNSVLQSISSDIRLDKIASCRSSDGKVFLGFETIYEITRRMPLLVPMSWILLIMKPTVGNYIYRLISRNLRRKINCGTNENCSLP